MTNIYFENFILSEQKKWLGENKGYYRKCSCLVPVVITNNLPSFPRDGGKPNRGGNTVLQKTASHRLPCLAYHYDRLNIVNAKNRQSGLLLL